MRRTPRLVGAVVLALVVVGCGDDAPTSSPQPEAGVTDASTTTTGDPSAVRTVAEPSDLIGSAPPAGVEGWDRRSGAVLDEGYVVSTWSTDRAHVVLLERSTGRLPDGSPTSVVVDVASIGLGEAHDSYDALPGDCRNPSGNELRDVVGLASGPDPHYNPATVAWRIDLARGTLTRVDRIDGIACWTGNPD